MAKTVEEIKAEVTALVKSQGNQGAISLGTVLDDITELAGEGGGGGGGSTAKNYPVKFHVDGGAIESASITPEIATQMYNEVAAGENVIIQVELDAESIFDVNISTNLPPFVKLGILGDDPITVGGCIVGPKPTISALGIFFDVTDIEVKQDGSNEVYSYQTKYPMD